MKKNVYVQHVQCLTPFIMPTKKKWLQVIPHVCCDDVLWFVYVCNLYMLFFYIQFVPRITRWRPRLNQRFVTTLIVVVMTSFPKWYHSDLKRVVTNPWLSLPVIRGTNCSSVLWTKIYVFSFLSSIGYRGRQLSILGYGHNTHTHNKTIFFSNAIRNTLYGSQAQLSPCLVII